ncbi:hypothetical protein [Variovorax sp. LjRoot178]|uniref:hypothetical protein n=1 Tax=Variovorax sp. LjRoot178 TaxID=3342277 RepID=UPI003ECCFB89
MPIADLNTGSMSFRSKTKPPTADPDQKVLRSVEVAREIRFPKGESITFNGEALAWDTADGNAVALLFEADWYARRSIEVVMWTEGNFRLKFSSGALAKCEVVEFEGEEGKPVGHRLTLHVIDRNGGLTESIRLTIAVDGSGAGAIYFGIDGNPPGTQTLIRSELVLDRRVCFLASTWVNLIALLLIVATMTGLKTAVYASPALLLIPALFKQLGVPWPESFNVPKLALMLFKRLPRLATGFWSFLGLSSMLMLSYVMAALAVFLIFLLRMPDTRISDGSQLSQATEFFCKYPERVEARALLARYIHRTSGSSGSVKGYHDATRLIPIGRFQAECASMWRLAPLFYDINARRDEDGLVLYASLWWNSIGNDRDFDEALKAIREILRTTPRPSGMAALTLAKYETRAVKNMNEQRFCKDEKQNSEDCRNRREQCAAIRDKFVRLLDEGDWKNTDMNTVTFIESLDVAASSFMSRGCAISSPDDAKIAVNHLRELAGVIEPLNASLEDGLYQINFRKFLESQLEKHPAHATSEEWQRECKEYHPDVCQLLLDTVAYKRTQGIFSPEQRLRQIGWDKPSIISLEEEEFSKKIKELAQKDWKWPLS